jgi:hypothetical protein
MRDARGLANRFRALAQKAALVHSGSRRAGRSPCGGADAVDRLDHGGYCGFHPAIEPETEFTVTLPLKTPP